MNALTLRIALTFCILAVSSYCYAATSLSSPFVAAGGGVWTIVGAEIIPEVYHSSSTDPVIVHTGTLSGPAGTYRASFGSAGFSSVVSGQVDRDAEGGTIWSDGFTVTGGSGLGSLIVSSQVDGSIFGRSEVVYALYVSSKPFSLDIILSAVGDAHGFWRLELPASTRVLFTGAVNGCNIPKASRNCGHLPYEEYEGSLSLTVATNVPFTYGETLYVASLFGGGSVFEGSTSFLNSAKFGITAPSTSTMNAMSGAIFAAAVPEPHVWMLLVIALTVGALHSRHYSSPLRLACFTPNSDA